MIINLLLGVIQAIVSVLLSPLIIINFAVDIVSSVSIVSNFIKIIAYLFPWSAITPLIFIIISMFAFRIIISFVKTVWDLIPFL